VEKEGLCQTSAEKRELIRSGSYLGTENVFDFVFIYSRDIATLHVDCRDKNESKKEIQELTMTFILPYFLVYQETIATSGSVKLSSVRNTGHLVFQVGERSISKQIRFAIMSDFFKFCNK